MFFLRQWRQYRKLTLEQLAEKVGTSKSYVSEIERGVVRYNQDTLESLAAALNCSPADLLSRDPTAPQDENAEIFDLWEHKLDVEGRKDVLDFARWKTRDRRT